MFFRGFPTPYLLGMAFLLFFFWKYLLISRLLAFGG